MAEQRLTAVIGANIRQFERAMKDVQSRMEDVQGSFQSISDGLAPVSAGLGAFGGAGILASENVTNAFKQFQTKLGATGSDLGVYKGELEQLASTGVGSFEEMAGSMVSVKQNMKGLNNGELDGMTEQAMHLANVMGSDVGEVSKTAGIMMKNFGISGQEAMDLISKGYQNGMDYAGDYQDTLSEYSVYFDSMGFSANDMFNILAEGAENGAFNLDKVGDAMKEFGIRAKDGSDTTKQAFTDLGFDAQKMTDTFAKGGEGAKKAYADVVTELSKVKDETKRNEIGVALFGTQYEDMEKDVIASTGTIVDHMGDVGGTAKQMAKDNQTFGQQMQGAWNDIQVAIKPVGEALKGAILAVMPMVVSAVQGLATAFGNLSPAGQKVVFAIGGIVAIVPILLAGLAGFMGMISTLSGGFALLTSGFLKVGAGVMKLVSVFKTVGQAFMWLGRLFMANPWMIIVTALIAVGVLIYQNWDAIQAWLTNAWNVLKQTVAKVFNWIVEFFKKWGLTILAVILGPIGILALAIHKNWDSIKQGAVNIWGKIKSFLANLWNNIVSIAKTVFNTLKNAISNAFNTIKSTAIGIWNGIKSSIVGVWNGLKSTATSVFNGIKNGISNAFNSIKSTASNTWNAIKNAMTKPVESAKNAIKRAIDSIKGFFSGLKLKFPKISMPKLPKFTMSGKFSLKPPSVPKLGISWHESGGVFSGSKDGRVVGLAENHGDEAILPLSKRSKFKPFATALAGMIGKDEESSNGTTVNNNFNISSLVVREEADIKRIAQELQKLSMQKNRAGGVVLRG
ncbi:phage tail tape measure protein [Cytobacillus kochii]|uniref:phage tail tape measure protein n=1 Tax=Cytobacillus kochii TaxID=859143 RepID=UPI001CD69C34|nr:phage tail tape measure protein [Cytobacillus kochii]MCA1025789.1 phage tail tape measure protein [Cytobacillus kochii]